MITQEILIKYKKQNPEKYSQKFGDFDPLVLEGVIGTTHPDIHGRVKEVYKGYTREELTAIMKGIKDGNDVESTLGNKEDTSSDFKNKVLGEEITK